MGVYALKSWSLYNREEKLRIDDLTLEQVKIILLAISTRRMPEWYACQPGDLSWKPLSEIPEYLNEVRAIQDETVSMKKAIGGDVVTRTKSKVKAAKSPSAQPKAKTKVKSQPKIDLNAIDGANILTIHDLIVDKSQTQERRSARRYSRKISFQVTRNENSFVSQTVDISMNGLSIREALPSWIPRSFSAHLQLNQYKISIQCERVSDHQLKIIAAESWDLIRQWIVNY